MDGVLTLDHLARFRSTRMRPEEQPAITGWVGPATPRAVNVSRTLRDLMATMDSEDVQFWTQPDNEPIIDLAWDLIAILRRRERPEMIQDPETGAAVDAWDHGEIRPRLHAHLSHFVYHYPEPGPLWWLLDWGISRDFRRAAFRYERRAAIIRDQALVWQQMVGPEPQAAAGAADRRARASSAPLEKEQIATEADLESVAARAAMCPICFQDFEVGDEVTTLPCNMLHCYHTDCIDEWFARSSTCPTCRAEMPWSSHAGSGITVVN